MAEFEKIEDLEQLQSWLATQGVRISRAIAARASQRCLPVLMKVNDQTFEETSGQSLLLPCLRATLLTGVSGNCATPVLKQVRSASHSARSALLALSARAAVGSALSSAVEAINTTTLSEGAVGPIATSAAQSADHAAQSASFSAATFANNANQAATFSAAASAARSAVFEDATRVGKAGAEGVFALHLWRSTNHIAHLLEFWEEFAARPDPDDIWSFWKEWYQGMLSGTPMNWDLQLKVAIEIGDEVWDKGAEAVANEIKRIREDFETSTNANQDRFPEYEPKSVKHLIENRVVATASLQGLSVQITDATQQYHAETKINALPDAFQPLSEMPALLQAIASTLQAIPKSAEVSPATEQQLRIENGRLNAKIAELQSEIAALKSKVAELSETEKRGISFWLGQTALWGTLVGGIWATTEDLEIRQRHENFINNKEELRQLIWREGLPQTQVENSLRPATRPDRN